MLALSNFSGASIPSFYIPSFYEAWRVANRQADWKQITLERNTALFKRAEAAAAKFKEARLNREESGLTDRQFKALENASARLAFQVLRVSKLMQITPEHGEDVLNQVIEKENVHRVANSSELLTHRLGMEGMNKDCQALVVETEDGLKVLAQIFRFHAQIPTEEGNKVRYENLIGDVDLVKASGISQLTGLENLTAYWTISSKWFGSGPELVKRLIQAMPIGHNEMTISPVRAFTDKQSRELLMQLSDDEIREHVLNHLNSDTRDDVRDFHLGNGAYVGWIHVNRNAPEGSRDWITVNYIYDRKRLRQNKRQFNKGFIPVSSAIQAKFKSISGLFCDNKSPFLPKPALIAA